jgi:hypothetical protein
LSALHALSFNDGVPKHIVAFMLPPEHPNRNAL